MNKIPFQDGTKTQEAYVTVNGQNYLVTPAVWSGDTPLSAFNLNKLQDNVEEAINIQRATVTLENTVNANTNYTLPTGIYYKVGNDSLEVHYCDTKLKKSVDYNEVGSIGQVSNTIQFLSSIGDLDMSTVDGFENFEETLEFIVRGDYDDN
jgi:hypothetical protein|nr:MAG TPA: hypothetical protein [Caudoviricetes sp.]